MYVLQSPAWCFVVKLLSDLFSSLKEYESAALLTYRFEVCAGAPAVRIRESDSKNSMIFVLFFISFSFRSMTGHLYK